MSVNATAEQEVVSRSMSATAEQGQVNSLPKKVAKPWYKNKRCMIPLIFIIIALLVAVIVGGLAAGGVFDSETKSQGLSEGDSSNVVQLEEDTTTTDPAIAGDSGDSSQSTTSTNSDGSITGSSATADSGSSTPVAVDDDRFIDGYLPPAKYTADEIAEIKPDWQIFEDLVIPWSEWSALCGDGICGEGEWCRNCPQDCECTFNCGNGVCEDGENGWTCADDCTHIAATCGDGVCHEEASFATNSTIYRSGFESPLICPIDCPLEDSCGDGVCSATESCFTCPSDCGGMCAPVCGDAKCDPTEGCDDCSRDCGACNTILNDGICAWPRETIVNAPNDCKAYIAPGFQFVEYEGVRYATLTGVNPLEETFNDTSCVSIETFIPNGWKMASNNNRTAELLKKYFFATGCAIVEGGIALASAGELQEYCSDPPLTTKLHGDGRVSVAFSRYARGQVVHNQTCTTFIMPGI
ncbi:hypothetical protein SARC_08516 [Sphaeroforma arctica JP610]|uniref:Uncharacterized protein n=1 Tax=Sphaeroforma arctica JP610 TaxID=667725 RepID=A0A0L0FQX6_9EUKA|nr:hypothetical protein SARC_08516 [Sphaeroforma arctica JP610]KNC79084.1 hypothetical protein SARC_08516 [Sphaeroforma arctica JP610]|eukprot:XP_014152986.1 hypothetical protein SARC_08516 [Sphaeroforma arctica JP610]